MSQSSSNTSKLSNKMELMQNLFKEILQIQREDETTVEAVARVQEIVQESEKAVENSMLPYEMIVDAKILLTGSNYVCKKVRTLNTKLTPFSQAKYVSGVLSHIKNSNQVFPCQKEWMALSPVTYQMFKKTHPLSFLHGTFTLEPPPPKETARGERKERNKKIEPEKMVVSVLTEKEASKEEDSGIYDHIFKCLVKQYKKNGRQPVNYLSFILDPNSYWRTVENIFHFAFLVSDENVKMEVVSGLPVVEPILKNKEERCREKSPSNHFCFTLSVKDWEDLVERFQIHSPGIAPYVKKT